MISSFFLINKVSALDITGKSGRVMKNISSERVVIYDYNGINSASTSGLRYAIIPSSANYLYSDNINGRNSWVYNTSSFGVNGASADYTRYSASSLTSWGSKTTVNYLATDAHGNYSNVIEYSYYDIWNYDFTEILYCGDVVTECGPKTYEFNEDIDVTDISKIKITFELPEDTSNLEVDIKWTFDNYSSNSSGYITTPYLEFKHSNGDISLNQDISNLNGGDWFSDDYIATLLPDSDITEISLIVDTVKASGLLKANFSSKFPYSISYEYTEEVEDYFITISMDDYASISLIPKVYDIENGISSSVSSPIYKYGIYDVEIWEDLETKKVIDRWDNHSTSQFIYPMYSGYKNCVIHFIKKEVDATDRYIRFDSRYYSYVVKKYLNEEVTIINPNTNENITIPDTSDLYKYDSPVDKRFSFNSFLKPIKFVFESITDFYNNYCPEVVQYFFYLIFAFFVILVLIKIFL